MWSPTRGCHDRQQRRSDATDDCRSCHQGAHLLKFAFPQRPPPGESWCWWCTQPGHEHRICSNICQSTATSTNRNVTEWTWLATFAPIFSSFSMSVVKDQRFITLGRVRGRIGSKPDERGHRHEGPLLEVKRTKSARMWTSKLESPLLGAERTYWRHGRRVRC